MFRRVRWWVCGEWIGAASVGVGTVGTFFGGFFVVWVLGSVGLVVVEDKEGSE